MKIMLIVLVTAVLSSAGTYFYTTKYMAPSFYREVISKARTYVKAVRAPASDCSGGTGSLDDENPKTPQLKKMLKQINKSRKEKKEFLNQFEE